MRIQSKMNLAMMGLLASSSQIQATVRRMSEEQLPTSFVVIYLDDMGYGDLSLTGAIGYATSNIDRLAKEGVFFSHYYSPQAVCNASRAGLLTGCYPNRVGFSGALNHTAKTGINSELSKNWKESEQKRAKTWATTLLIIRVRTEGSRVVLNNENKKRNLAYNMMMFRFDQLT